MMPGQGKPLPPFMKLDGEWIIESYLFLYHSKLVGAPQATFTMHAERHDGELCIGFDSTQLAGALGLDIASVMSANRDGSLIVLGVADRAPTHGGTSAKTYGFEIGGRKAYLTVETDQQEGKA
jgi:hypothetical protein